MNNSPKTHAIFGTDLTKKVSVLIEELRKQMCQTRGQIHDISHEHKLWDERLRCVEGLLTCGIATLYGINRDVIDWEIKRDEEKRGLSYQFNSRGIGTDVCPGCFVCRSAISNYLSNISGFVKSKDDGQAIVSLFGGWAKLDYREFEPNRIQIKIGACDKHLDNLKKLDKQITENNNRIRQIDVDEARIYY